MKEQTTQGTISKNQFVSNVECGDTTLNSTHWMWFESECLFYGTREIQSGGSFLATALQIRR